jgi:hypothetical protein
MHKIMRLMPILVLLALGGCASVPMEAPTMDTDAKAFTPVPDKSVLYIFRDTGMGGAISIPVLVDGKLVGSTAAHVYFRVVVAPGNHELWAKASYDAKLSIATEPGKIYFIDQSPKMGVFYAGAGLKQVSEEEGEEDVKDCKLAKGNAIDQ